MVLSRSHKNKSRRNNIRVLLFGLLFFLFFHRVPGQQESILDKLISISFKNQKLLEALTELQEVLGFVFSYAPSSLDGQKSITKDGKLLLNYIHADINSFANFDGIFTAVLNASTLEVEEIIEDARSATPGYNLSQDHFFDSNADLYIGTTNSNYWGINENLSAGILRIRSGELEYDETYFFDVTSQINNEYFAGLAQLTDTKALIKVFRSDLIEQFADYSQKAVIEHWIVDVQTQTAEKLDIPLSLAPFADPVVLDDGNFGIVANTSEGSFIYIYDESTGSVQQGLEYEGIDFIRTITAIP